MKDDVELVTAALAGGPDAFAPVVERYQGAVFGVALARLRDFHEAEDVAQVAFVEAFERLGNLRDPSRLGAWLRSVTIHRCIDRLRQRRKTADVEDASERTSDVPMPHEALERQELCDRVLAAIGRLSKTQRETTTLFYIDGYSIEDVAAMQEVPAGTVKWRLHAAREKLKEEMTSMVEDVLKSEAPKENFGKQVFEILSRYQRPKVPWQEWEEIAAKLREIGAAGVDGFAQAFGSRHSPTRIFATKMLIMSGRGQRYAEELLKKALADPNRHVRKGAFLSLLNIMEADEDKRRDLMPCVLSLLTDRSKRNRATVPWYLCHAGDYAKDVPLECVARAVVSEPIPWIREQMIELMRAVLEAQDANKDKT